MGYVELIKELKIMAYMNQDKKKVIKAALDKALKGTGVKFSLRVRNHMAISLNIKSAPVDFIANFNDTVAKQPGGFRNGSPAEKYLQVNQYWYKEHFSGKALELLQKAIPCLYAADYYDNSDAMTDYFDTAYYVDVNIGNWDKPFEVK
jgi:hypothetical protein